MPLRDGQEVSHSGVKSLSCLLPFIPATCCVAIEISEDCDKLKSVAFVKEAATIQDQVIWPIQEIRPSSSNVLSWKSGAVKNLPTF